MLLFAQGARAGGRHCAQRSSRNQPFSSCSGPPARLAVRANAGRAAGADSTGGLPSWEPASESSTAEPWFAAAPRLAAVAAAAAAVLLLPAAPPALAFGPVSVRLEDISVSRVECGAGTSTVGGVTFSGARSKAACLDVSASATNSSGKPLYNADVFGRVYDVNGEAAIDDTENIRIAYIDEIPPGTSQVLFKLFVPAEQYDLGPLRLQGFKATGFPGKMLPNTTGSAVDAASKADCEILGDCDDLEAEAAIR